MRASALLAATILTLAINPAVAQLPFNPPGQVEVKHAAPAWKGILAAQADGVTKLNKRQFVMQCKLSTVGKLRKSGKVIADPRLIVSESRPTKIERLSQSPFVTGVTVVGDAETDKTALQPVITVLDEGYTIEAEVTPLDDTHVQLDASLTLQQVNEVEEIDLGRCKTQAPNHNKVTRRILRAVRFGETQEIRIAAAGKNESIVFAYTITPAK